MAARRRGWLWLVAGLVFALLAALIAMAAVELRVQQETAATPVAETTPEVPVAPVVVAAAHVPITKAITAGDVNLQEWPVDIIPEGAATVIDDVIGKVAMTEIYAGEAVMAARLADPDVTTENLAFTMPDGTVIFALPADDLMSSIDLLRAGDVVDVLFSLKPEADAKASTVVTQSQGDEAVVLGDPLFTTDVLQAQSITAMVIDMPTIAPGEAEETVAEATTAKGEPRAILLALNPQDALILKYFRDSGGMMDIVLRHRGEDAPFDVETVNYDYVKDLYGLPEPPTVLGQ